MALNPDWDTVNKFAVGVQQNDIVFILPIPRRMSKEDAQNLGATLCALSFDSPEDAAEAVTKICNV